MKYDPRTPIAVFLGPSLAKHKAERVLQANYYPPVRMGDVYRLMATGVQTIVIIDGVFHNTTPVWQRELVAAIDKGITVVGASSMGALRAAELDRLGMIGHGQIYQWYRDGVIDGDDEVSLLHADEALGYQSISEPMVNIRYNLGLAVERSVLTSSQASTLLSLVKARYFGDRSYHLLLQSALVMELALPQRNDLIDLLTESPVNLKQKDATSVLRYCAELAGRQPPPCTSAPASSFPRPVVETAYPALETFKRGLLTDEGHLVEISVIFEALKNDAALMATQQSRCASNFYLSELARASGLSVPVEFLECFRTSWIQTHMVGEPECWLRQVGLTRNEFDRLVQAHATRAYLLAQTPESLGLDFANQRIVIEALAHWYSQTKASDMDKSATLAQERTHLSVRGLTGCLVTHWAQGRGIQAPQAVIDDFIERWEQREGIDSRQNFLKTTGLTEPQFHSVWAQQAMYQWMIEKGPAYFGYGTYSFPKDWMQDMQVNGSVRTLSRQARKESSL